MSSSPWPPERERPLTGVSFPKMLHFNSGVLWPTQLVPPNVWRCPLPLPLAHSRPPTSPTSILASGSTLFLRYFPPLFFITSLPSAGFFFHFPPGPNTVYFFPPVEPFLVTARAIVPETF